MKNVKDEVYAALCTVCSNVTDAYPVDWTKLPTIAYSEEQNAVYERTGNVENKAQVRYRIDIYDKSSTSAMALDVDGAVSALGLVRTTCMDVNDPQGWKHKTMIYEGIIDMESDIVYWNGY